MPEEGLETAELREHLEQANEHAEHAAHGGEHEKRGEPWVVSLSLSTAILAVLAAIAALFSGGYANDALAEKNEAVLALGEETDAWAFYQARSIKKAVYETQAQAIGSANPGAAAAFHAKSEEEAKGQEEPKKLAEGAKKAKLEHIERSEHFFHIHHEFALSVTIFQVAIALAAIAALTKRKPLWLMSLVVGAGGLFFTAMGAKAAMSGDGNASPPGAPASAPPTGHRE